MNIENILILIRKEMRESLRNRWFILYSAAFAVLALAISWLALAGADQYGFAGFGSTAAGLVNLVMLIVPLMALSAGAGSFAGEKERGTLGQLLAMPVTRLEVLLGKFLGLTIVLAITLTVGFGISGIVILLEGGQTDGGGYLTMVALACFLATAMLSVGLLISVLNAKSSTAGGIAIIIWLALAFGSDLGLMGSAILFRLHIWSLFNLAVSNPLEVFKMATLYSSHASLHVLGPAGRYAMNHYGSGLWGVFLTVLGLWVVIPLGLTWWSFQHGEVP
ncbi:MAG: ABC transporter permease [Phycisphaerae bacterium]